MPVAKPWLRSNSCSTPAETTWIATRPKPVAATPPKARRKATGWLVAADRKQPAARLARPRAMTARAPCLSTMRPPSGARIAIMTSAAATTDEVKLRLQPSSASISGITKPKAARAE